MVWRTVWTGKDPDADSQVEAGRCQRKKCQINKLKQCMGRKSEKHKIQTENKKGRTEGVTVKDLALNKGNCIKYTVGSYE